VWVTPESELNHYLIHSPPPLPSRVCVCVCLCVYAFTPIGYKSVLQIKHVLLGWMWLSVYLRNFCWHKCVALLYIFFFLSLVCVFLNVWPISVELCPQRAPSLRWLIIASAFLLVFGIWIQIWEIWCWLCVCVCFVESFYQSCSMICGQIHGNCKHIFILVTKHKITKTIQVKVFWNYIQTALIMLRSISNLRDFLDWVSIWYYEFQ